ncbi:MAG TPA: efflux RND transporter periplasmic adaptor subunit [Casimicrobiaceae bacterium]|nr:efflux RND transporter periplasmic adaptor subunit [Casimicrobiaceae bacterium]
MSARWIVAAVALVLAACGAPPAPQQSVRPVQLTRVAVGNTGEAAVFAGEVKPRHEADLGFRIGGKVTARLVDVGARVKKGQTLARLDPADTGLQAEAAKAQVAATETEYRFAQAEYQRYQNLYREKFISASALDAKRSAQDANRARYEQAIANLAVASNQASYATLLANEDGVVTAVGAEPGQVVTAGQAVVRIAREDEREVAISVPESRIGEVKDARSLVVMLWAQPSKQYRAHVREIAPAVDAMTRTFAVRVSIDDADPSLSWGMTANVAVLGAGDAQGALLPLTSIYHRDGAPAVWRYDAATGRVSLTPVSIAQYREDGVIVTSGVANGDWIVGAGVHKLIPGEVVRPYDAGPSSASGTPAAARARS